MIIVKYQNILVSCFIAVFMSNIFIIGGSTEPNIESLGVNSNSNEVEKLDFNEKKFFNEFTPGCNLFGYSLNFSSIDPLSRDEEASLFISNDLQGLNIQISSSLGFYQITKMNCYSETKQASSDKIIYFENILRGFFMEIHVYDEFARVNIVFEFNSIQCTYDGILKYKDDYLAQRSYNLNEIENYAENYEFNLRKNQNNGIHIIKSEVPQMSIAPTRLAIYTYNYGIAHILYDAGQDHDDDDTTYMHLLGNYWLPHTVITSAFYRFLPTESAIKSDLQVYNKDEEYNGRFYVRDIRAYNILAEDNGNEDSDWEIMEWDKNWLGIWKLEEVGQLTSTEVSSLWFQSSNPRYISSQPTNMIIFAHVCYGKVDNNMANAFVNNGALSFIGNSEYSYVYFNNDADEPMFDFWNELCQQYGTVQEALDVYETELEDVGIPNSGWAIQGSSTTRLP